MQGRDAYDCSRFTGSGKKVRKGRVLGGLKMDRDMILFNGLRCKVNTKAAFVDMCMQTPALASKMMESPAVMEECGKKLYTLEEEEKSGVFALRVELNEEKRERIYEEVFGEKLTDGRFGKLSDIHQRLLEPIRIMHKKEMGIDVVPFIAYAEQPLPEYAA